MAAYLNGNGHASDETAFDVNNTKEAKGKISPNLHTVTDKC